MKFAMVILGGAADKPVTELQGKTPLEASSTPHLDALSRSGRLGTVRTVPAAMQPETDVAVLSLLGYDPTLHHAGFAAYEFAARGWPLEGHQIAFRCNFIAAVAGRLRQPAPARIAPVEAARLILDLNHSVAGQRELFLQGDGHRHALVISEAADIDVRCATARSILDQAMSKHLPAGSGRERLVDIMNRARILLGEHEVNFVRRDLGEDPVTDIWLWGPGRAKGLPEFKQMHHGSAALVAGMKAVQGIGKVAGMSVISVPGATGGTDTDYSAKGRAAVAALETHDMVVVHVRAPDDAAHQGEVRGKVAALESIDSTIVGPLAGRLHELDKWRLLVTADHVTSVERRVHSSEAVPFCLAGSDVEALLGERLTEATAQTGDLHITAGHNLMEFFLRR